jgi:hypothetical protein
MFSFKKKKPAHGKKSEQKNTPILKKSVTIDNPTNIIKNKIDAQSLSHQSMQVEAQKTAKLIQGDLDGAVKTLRHWLNLDIHH